MPPPKDDELEKELGVEGTEKEGTEAEPDITEPEPEKEKPAPALTAADIAAAVAGALQPRGLSPEQQEQEWLRLEAESGMTRQQLMFNDSARREANLRDNLPIYEQLGESRAEKTLGAVDKDLLPKVKEMMAKHPANVRSNPQAWEDAAFLIKGKFGGTHKPAAKKDDEPGKVVGAGGKVNPGLSEGRGAGAGGGKGGKKKEYSELEQRIIDTTCGGDAEKYEAYRDKGSTKPRDVKTEGTNRADLAMQSLTRGVKI